MLHDYSSNDTKNSTYLLNKLSGYPKLLTAIDENKIPIFSGPLDYQTRVEMYKEAKSRLNGEEPRICGRNNHHTFTDYRDDGIEKVIFSYNNKDHLTYTITFNTKTNQIRSKK